MITPETRKAIEDYLSDTDFAIREAQIFPHRYKHKKWLRECLDEIERLREVLEVISAPKDLADYGYAVELARKALKERG